MKKLFTIFLAVCALSRLAFATVTPASLNSEFQHVNWSLAGVQASYLSVAGPIVDGVPTAVSTYPGTDIPYRTALTFASVYGVVADGVTDDTAAVANAIAATPTGGVCLLPAGILVLNGGVQMKPGITLRGAGMLATVLKFTGLNGVIMASPDSDSFQWAFEDYAANIISGATAGSNVLTIDDPEKWWMGHIERGEFFVITDLNDSSLVEINNLSNPNSDTYTKSTFNITDRHRGQLCYVEDVSSDGATITFSPPLFSNFSRTPKYSRPIRKAKVGSGIESLTLYATGLDAPRINAFFENALNCWMYDVRGDFATTNHALLRLSQHCTIRKCHFYESFTHTSGSDNEVGIKFHATYNLVVDNIIERVHTGVVFSHGAAGNVVAHNLIVNCYDDSEGVLPPETPNRALGIAYSLNHTAHPQFNLTESNLTTRFVADSIWGTSSHGVLLGNQVLVHQTSHGPYSTRSTSGTWPSYELYKYTRGIDLWWGNSHYIVLGNVLGDSTTTAASGAVRKTVVGSGRSQTIVYLISLGYAANDTDSDSTTEYPILAESPRADVGYYEHANFDYVTGGQVFDPSVSDHALPNSLYLTDAQLLAFLGFTGRVFDAETASTRTDEQNRLRLPAYARWVAGSSSGGSAGSPHYAPAPRKGREIRMHR